MIPHKPEAQATDIRLEAGGDRPQGSMPAPRRLCFPNPKRERGTWAGCWLLVLSCWPAARRHTSPKRERGSSPASRPRPAFTLVELLITVSIIAIMAGMVLFAYSGAVEQAKEQKTRAMIAKLDAIIKAKWDSYKTRRVPLIIQDEYVDINPNDGPNYVPGTDQIIQDFDGNSNFINFTPLQRAQRRLNALRDLMRLELPDRWSDIVDDPVVLANTTMPGMMIARPAASQAYLRRYTAATPTDDLQGAECLYLIVTAALAEEGDAREVFSADDIKDTDGDGIPEFLDGWGTPIRFIRWPVGFPSDLNILATVRVANVSPGPPMTVQVDAASTLRLSTAPGSYIGGALVFRDPSSGTLLGNQFGRITGYQPGPPPEFTVVVPTMPPGISAPGTAAGDIVAVMAPDPLDPRTVDPYSFGMYPLIYSAGPDKVYGVVADVGTSTVAAGLSPFARDLAEHFTGTQKPLPGENPSVTNGWLDNIHNHAQGTR